MIPTLFCSMPQSWDERPVLWLGLSFNAGKFQDVRTLVLEDRQQEEA